jgi:ATP-dependent Clp protease adaptor protein ClpS
MAGTTTIERPVVGTKAAERLEDMYQVILHNDDHNTMDHVVSCLMRVFGHSEQLAAKIMLEADEKGKAIAEVEAETPAKLHRDQLQSFSLSATVEKL